MRLRREEFQKLGDVSSRLTAPILGLRHARSENAERVLDQAIQFQRACSTDQPKIQWVSDRLKKILPSDDPIRRRWVYFAERARAMLYSGSFQDPCARGSTPASESWTCRSCGRTPMLRTGTSGTAISGTVPGANCTGHSGAAPALLNGQR